MSRRRIAPVRSTGVEPTFEYGEVAALRCEARRTEFLNQLFELVEQKLGGGGIRTLDTELPV
jgi:hypothetical protein